MADPKEWGTVLWNVVHTICEHLGTNTNITIQQDEIRYFKAFQNKLFYILPCKICRNHYKEYLKNIKNVKYTELKSYAREYFFELHNKIRSSKGEELFKKEDLEVRYNYSREDYIRIIREFNTLYNKYTNLQYISFDELKDFNRILTILRRFINF